MSADLLRWTGAGLMLTLAWLLPRWVAGARLRWSRTLPVDLLLPLALFAVVLSLGSRPLLAGLVAFAAGAGWARADQDKRRVLREPIVFTDLFQALDILRHPGLALPFPHKGLIVLGSLALIAVFALVIRLEPAVTAHPGLWLLTGLAMATWSGMRWLTSPASLDLRADPTRDTARHGPFATLLLHALYARRERKARAGRLLPPAWPSSARAALDGPVVLIQSESFFDARRLHPALPQDLLPHFDRCRAEAMLHGPLEVPCWGANTVRTEFAVLTGVPATDLGFDHLNPYARFVSGPIRSLAWDLRARGYRTICLHPFDRRFYRRDQVMPLLGFDEFLGEELFETAPRINGYVSDLEVEKVALSLIRERGPKLFLFVITMENHGPWSGAPDRRIGELAALPLDEGEQLRLNHYLSSLVHADHLLGALRTELAAQPQPAVLGFYGDHLPSLPGIFSRLDWQDSRSDYLIWRSDRAGGRQQTLSATGFAAAMLSGSASR